MLLANYPYRFFDRDYLSMFSVKLEIDDKTPEKTVYAAKFPKKF